MGSCLGSGGQCWAPRLERGWGKGLGAMLTLSYLITRCAGRIQRASRWHRQVMGWGQGQALMGVDGHLCPLQGHSWAHRAERGSQAPGPLAGHAGPGEGASLQSPVAVSSLGTKRDWPVGTCFHLTAEKIQAQGGPPGSQSSCCSTRA